MGGKAPPPNLDPQPGCAWHAGGSPVEVISSPAPPPPTHPPQLASQPRSQHGWVSAPAPSSDKGSKALIVQLAAREITQP